MKKYSAQEMKEIYSGRRAKIVEYLKENNVGAAVFIDSEAHRDPSIRYFTGHTSDAVLVILQNGSSTLVPWDEILAKK